MSQKPIILVTGFERFNDFQLNTSQIVIEHLNEHPPSSVILQTRVLPTSFRRASNIVDTSFDEMKPDAVLLLGQLTGISGFKVETITVNIDDAYTPDNDNYKPSQLRIIASGPVAYESSWPAALIVGRLTTNGIPACISNNAGTYVCNHVFYTTLHHITETKAKTICGFIHLPCLPEEASRFAEPLPSMTFDLILRGIKYVLDTLVETLEARINVSQE